MHEVLVNRLGGLSLPRKSVVRLTDRPGMTLDVYRGRKTTMQQQWTVTYRSSYPDSCIIPFKFIDIHPHTTLQVATVIETLKCTFNKNLNLANLKSEDRDQ